VGGGSSPESLVVIRASPSRVSPAPYVIPRPRTAPATASVPASRPQLTPAREKGPTKNQNRGGGRGKRDEPAFQRSSVQNNKRAQTSATPNGATPAKTRGRGRAK
jgi:hypothetical protein